MLGVLRKQTQQQESKNKMKHPLRNGLLFESVSVKEAAYQTFYEKGILPFFFWTLVIGVLSIAKEKKFMLDFNLLLR